MEPQTNFETQNLKTETSPALPPKNSYKILFFLSLGLFLVTISVLVTLLITQKSSQPTQAVPTDTEETELTPTETVEPEAESITSTQMETTLTPTKSATVTSTTKTAFQKMIINWNLYQDITTSERIDLSGTGDWMGNVKSTDSLYSFVQKMLKGSFKKLTISKSNLNTILGEYSYNFYITPNYEKWSNEKFQTDFIPEYAHSGIGELAPLYAYSDKLVWSSSLNCGGARPDAVAEQKAQDQCESLVKEIETAFP